MSRIERLKGYGKKLYDGINQHKVELGAGICGGVAGELALTQKMTSGLHDNLIKYAFTSHLLKDTYPNIVAYVWTKNFSYSKMGLRRIQNVINEVGNLCGQKLSYMVANVPPEYQVHVSNFGAEDHLFVNNVPKGSEIIAGYNLSPQEHWLYLLGGALLVAGLAYACKKCLKSFNKG